MGSRRVFGHRTVRTAPAWWLAFAAAGLLALWPLVAGAAAASRQVPAWLEVCRAQGPRGIAAASGGDAFGAADLRGVPGAPAGGTMPEHCPLCSVAAPVLAPPPASRQAVFELTTPPRTATVVGVRLPAAVWDGARSRAPPAHV